MIAIVILVPRRRCLAVAAWHAEVSGLGVL
jgi:hypothetical protein